MPIWCGIFSLFFSPPPLSASTRDDDEEEEERFSSIDTDASTDTTEATDSTALQLSLSCPEHALAAQILQILGVAVKELHLSLFHAPPPYDHLHSSSPSSIAAFLPHQIAHFLVHVVQMCESGSFKRVVDALRLIARQREEEVTLKGLMRLSRLNAYFLDVASSHPTLTLLWARLLTHLRWATTDMAFWQQLTTTTHYGTKPGHFETSKIHFPTSKEVSERTNE